MSLLRKLLVDPSSIGGAKPKNILVIAHRDFTLPSADEIIIAHMSLMPTVTLYPTEDCSVDERIPDTNLDDSGFLAVGSGGVDPWYSFYLRFDLSSLAGKVIGSSILRLYQYAGAGSQPLYIKKVADDTWQEESITWNNKPAVGDTLVSFSAGSGAAWIDYESGALGVYVADEAPGLVSFAFTGGTLGHYRFYRDREYNSGAYQPRLIVEAE